MSDLSLYLHIPFCRCKCSYCSFVSFAGREVQLPSYVDALSTEMHLTHRPGAVVKTVYFGGGTPSLLQPVDVKRLLSAVHECYAVDTSPEITLEANPGTIDGDYLSRLWAAGVNRLSLGVQSLDDGDLAFLGRLHSASGARQAIGQARAAGFDNLSLDFIYGLPHRRILDWDRMLDGIIDLGADHLSLYGLTLEPGTPLGDAAARGEFSLDADAAASEYELASKKLNSAGYRHYEISNWARPGFESRHNTVYWRRGDYLGLGAAAHSFLEERRIANVGGLDGYMEALGDGHMPPQEMEVIDDATALSETIILGLRLSDGVALNDIGHRFKIDLPGRYAAEIAELSEMGLVEVTEGRLWLSPRGRLLGNEVFLRFLPA